MKYAYIGLVIAALAVSSQMFIDLLDAEPVRVVETKNTLGSSADTSATTDCASDTTDLLDPKIEQRINQILLRDDSSDVPVEGAGNTSDEMSADSAADISQAGQEEVSATSIDDASDRATLLSAPPIPQQTPLHDQMITPGNFLYVGAFRPPHQERDDQKFSHGGWGVAFHSAGDPGGADDGYPGSLFLVGHRHHGNVAEISIPAPVVSSGKQLDDLPVAKVLQPFSDITGGIKTAMTNGSSEPFEIGGMQVVNNQLHWTIYKYYNVIGRNYPSHGLSSTQLNQPHAQGLWHLGPEATGAPQWQSYKHAGYICDIPQDIADQYLGGRNLMSGLQISTGLQTSSQGPAFFAYRLPNTSPQQNAVIDALPLLWYPINRQVPGHHYADRWTGAAWLTIGNKHTVVAVGRKALGPVYYGDARPGDCYPDKGYHGSSYEAQMLFYAPGALIDGQNKSVPIVDPWFRWDANAPGGSLDRFMYQKCGKDIGGMAYDRPNNILYIVEANAGYTGDNEWESLPVVHVFRLVDGNSSLASGK